MLIREDEIECLGGYFKRGIREGYCEVICDLKFKRGVVVGYIKI